PLLSRRAAFSSRPEIRAFLIFFPSKNRGGCHPFSHGGLVMGTSKVLMALTGCLLISGAVADDATVVIEDNAQITYISQARIGDTRLLAWRSDGSGDSIRLMAAFVDANTHQLLDGPFELGAANETFDCPDGANPHGRVTCELTSLLGSYPTVHGSEDSGQFLVT